MNIPFLAGSAFAIFGIYLFGRAVRDYGKARASQEWPATKGRLTDVRLWGTRNIDGEIKDTEKLIVEYEYQVNGLKYTGRAAAFYTLVYPATVEFADSHPANSDVQVYYNPEKPDECVLIPGHKKDKPYSELILAALASVAGVVVAVLGGAGVIG